jgi:hypothetical protein
MLEEVYLDRNLLAIAFARMAQQAGWQAGWSIDASAPDWYVIYVETPYGQVSWHIPPQLLEGLSLPQHPLPWDGHDIQEKRRRLAMLTQS